MKTLKIMWNDFLWVMPLRDIGGFFLTFAVIAVVMLVMGAPAWMSTLFFWAQYDLSYRQAGLVLAAATAVELLGWWAWESRKRVVANGV